MREFRSGELLRKIVSKLTAKYGYEADSLAMILLEDALKISRNDILLDSKIQFDSSTEMKLEDHLQQLLNDVPVQHILGVADFYGYKFKVDESVLVPRQETEEMVLLVSEIVFKNKYSTLLDIGTGSGCIAISLALEDQNLRVFATDISESALEIAKSNSKTLGASVEFIKSDILIQSPEHNYDAIISNPPYVLDSEKKILQANVLDYDPEIALYVSDDNPLIFYKRITDIAKSQLNESGLLFFEINEKFGAETAELLQQSKFKDVNIRQDINGKDRFVYGFKT